MRKIHFILIMFFLISSSGCEFLKKNESLITPPQPASLINEAIESYVPSNALILEAVTGKYTNSYTLIDLDGDGLLEAILFYASAQDAVVQGLVLKETNGEWNAVQTFEGDGDELFELDFIDVTNDGHLDIIAGFSFKKEDNLYLNKGLVVYQYNVDKIISIFNTTYTNKVIDDLNEDGRVDLTTFLLDENHTSHEASIYNYVNHEMEIIDSMSLNPKILAANPFSGYVTKDQKGIVIDNVYGAHSLYTNILLFDGLKLKSVFNDEELPNYKATMLDSRDINRDGIIEIGIPRIPDGFEDAHAYTPYIDSFYQWDGEMGLEFVQERYDNYEYGYRFDFPWSHQNVTIESDLDFKEIKLISTVDGSLLFDIYVIQISEEDNLEGMIELARTDTYVYCTTVDNKSLQRNFHLL
ncbi:FG-GAP repeat domain-containing protein [Chengkuizengella marina]|uniref:VCBS repeat-containing protein n=1 Tax=Chengkuizengella marina TaxID=2507566 RepID=A0A6N9Q2P0_9BACL|nr:VCBS repeat-containing protein [Chengkuizengella marina]NBI28778.1 VCBS repeat-containing protein [Chengkuizengella marina]